MKKAKNDRYFSYLSLGLILVLMFCELSCGDLAKRTLAPDKRTAILADAGGSTTVVPTIPAPKGDGETSDAWSFVLAASIGILLIAVVIGLTAKKRKPRGK